MSWSTDNPRGDRNARRITQPDPGGSGGGAGIKVVKIIGGEGKQKSVECRVMKVTVPREDDEPLTEGLDVVLEETDKTLICINPRGNFLDLNVLYFAFQVDGFWCVDNQAVFQEWMGEDDDDDEDDEEEDDE
ncbi:hypothetical protein SH661x_003893 [Planctomicrobium sp. SH661]|uniref:hypothetical protein n=1 Tax=Planctomicrobium sp. SH661 TaxID=3448124 RepID=UPI003F5C8CC0